MSIDIERLRVDAEYWSEVAPDDATHMIDRHRFVKWESASEWQLSINEEDPRWVESGNPWSLKEYLRSSGWEIIARPVIAWTGTGLPPVGTECEVVIGAQKPRTVCFVGIKSSGSVVIETVDGELKSYHRSQVIFRPIRTQAQREREEIIIDALRHVDEPRDDEVHPRQYLMDALHTLYDAGMLRRAGE